MLRLKVANSMLYTTLGCPLLQLPFKKRANRGPKCRGSTVCHLVFLELVFPNICRKWLSKTIEEFSRFENVFQC